MDKVFKSVVMSSADPKKLGMTVSGILVAGIVPVMLLVRAFGVEGIDEPLLTQTIDSIAMVVQSAAALVSSLMVAFGFGRKIYLAIAARFGK